MKTVSYFLKSDPEVLKTIQNVIGVRYHVKGKGSNMIVIEYLDSKDDIQHARFELNVFLGDITIR